jgi:hypothetical protein
MNRLRDNNIPEIPEDIPEDIPEIPEDIPEISKDIPKVNVTESSSSVLNQLRGIAYNVFPFLNPGSKSNIIRDCENEEGDTSWVGRIYKYVYGIFRFPGTDGVFLRIITKKQMCSPGLNDFIRLIPQYIFYFVNLIILLSIVYPDSIYKGYRLQIIFGIGLLGIIAGAVSAYVIQTNKFQDSIMSLLINLSVYILLLLFYISFLTNSNTLSESIWKIFWIIVFSHIQWISPVLLLLLGPGVIPLIQQKSFIEFCL